MNRLATAMSTVLVLTLGVTGLTVAQEINGAGSDAATTRQLTGLELISRIGSGAPGALEAMGVDGVVELLAAYRDGDLDSSHTCEVFDGDTGAADGDIDEWNTFDIADWLRYDSGGLASNRVTFALVPTFSPNVLEVMVQRFNVTGSPSTSIITPAGVPFWGGGATQGQYVLVVLSDTGGTNFCFVTVTP